MARDISLPTDAAGAEKFLAELAQKDADRSLCRFPTCANPVREASPKGGQPPAYCEEHRNSQVINKRIRDSLTDLASGLPPIVLSTEEPATASTVQSLRNLTLARLEQFQQHLALYVAALKELVDPDIVAAQLEAAKQGANALVADAQSRAETAISFQLAAENARDASQRVAQIAQNDASLASQKMQEALQQVEAYKKQLEYMLEKHNEALKTIQAQAQQEIENVKSQASEQIEKVEAQAKRDIALAQLQARTAQEEMNKAKENAQKTENDAQVRVTSAEKLLEVAQAALLREQREVERLRLAMEKQAKEAHEQAASYRDDIKQLRADAIAANQQARTQAGEDRTLIKQLRSDLQAATERGDELAKQNDLFRSQLAQFQAMRQTPSEARSD